MDTPLAQRAIIPQPRATPWVFSAQKGCEPCRGALTANQTVRQGCQRGRPQKGPTPSESLPRQRFAPTEYDSQLTVLGSGLAAAQFIRRKGEGGDRGGFRAQDERAEGKGLKMGGAGRRKLRRAEVALGAN